MHLTELVRTSFISATASVDQLKLAGYQALRVSSLLPSSSPTPISSNWKGKLTSSLLSFPTPLNSPSPFTPLPLPAGENWVEGGGVEEKPLQCVIKGSIILWRSWTFLSNQSGV